LKNRESFDRATVRGMVKDNVISHRVTYTFLSALISVLELLMILRGILTFDFSNPLHLAYFCSYIILFVASVFCFCMLVINSRKGTLYDFIAKLLNIYGAVIIIWSTVIAHVDIVRGRTMIVFLTVIICVASILTIDPLVFTLTVIPLTVHLLVLVQSCGAEAVHSSGYLINVGVFVLFSVLLTYFHYQLKLKAYSDKCKLESMSLHDQLTGAYNRHTLRLHLGELQPGSELCFGIVDVDNFKHINDTFGHDIGDACLRDLARLLQEQFGDEVYRYGGDEFVIITDLADGKISATAGVVNGALAELHPGEDVHISAGFYRFRVGEEDFTAVFRKADGGLYEAKRTGKNKFVFCTDEEPAKE